MRALKIPPIIFGTNGLGNLYTVLGDQNPDVYLAQAKSDAEAEKLYRGIQEAYTALMELKGQGRVLAVGVGR